MYASVQDLGTSERAYREYTGRPNMGANWPNRSHSIESPLSPHAMLAQIVALISTILLLGHSHFGCV